MTETSPKDSPANKPVKAFSCVRCFERKVKCDKENPCSGCVRSNVECVFRIPAPPRRKKKRTQEDILTERLNQYEQILQQKGIDILSVPSNNESIKSDASPQRHGSVARSDIHEVAPTASSAAEPASRSFVAPKLVWEDGRSRYTENNLWTRVTEEFRTSQDAIHESSDEEEATNEINEAEDNVDFALGQTPASLSVRSAHPPSEHISALWQVYLENVNPFTMLIHRPTMHASIQKAILNPDQIPRSLEAMMFGIYSTAICSMQDGEVETMFGDSKTRLLARYRAATKSALARAKFMGSSDILVLQALILHLLSMRDVYDGRTLWTLSGVAMRIAEGMGLHKDGTVLGLPPFVTEIRRRVWYQITSIDYRSAELSGSSKFRGQHHEKLTTKPPSNINDEDMWPGMTEPPVSRQKITDMIICCLRYEFGTFWADKIRNGDSNDGSIWENFKSPKTIEERDASVDELQARLEEKYVRYCDPSIPVQFMATVVARTATNTMRFMAHHPRRWASEEEVPLSERKLIWSLCTRILEGYVLCITSKSLRRFAWHTTFYFQWHALIYILDCVTAKPIMPEANDAWALIDEIFDCHPNFVTDTKKAIHVAVSHLCLKAYNAREQAYKREGRFLSAQPPVYIQAIRRQVDEAQAKRAERKARSQSRSEIPSEPTASATNDLMGMMGFEAANQVPPIVQQLPLPTFQVPTNNNPQQQQQHQHQQNQQQQQAMNQQAVPVWFDNFNVVSSLTGSDLDWMTLQDPIIDQGNQMDWSQWDTLLDDGTLGYGTIR